MKKFFNHTKRPYQKWEEYEEENYDWDDVDEIDEMEEAGDSEEDETVYSEEYETYDSLEDLEEESGEAEYYAEESEDEAEYYADSEGESGEEYYAEENEDEAEYYAEENEADEAYYADNAVESGEAYYAEEDESETEYYADNAVESEEGYYAEETESDEEYYADNAVESEEEYYAEDYPEESDEEEYYAEEDESEEEYYAGQEADAAAGRRRSREAGNGKGARKKGNVFVTLWNKFLDMSTMDRIVAATGAAVLIMLLVTGGVYVSARTIDKQVSEFAGVGSQLEGIDMIGEQGLLAVTDAHLARIAAANAVVEEEEQEQKEYEENEYSKNVTVALDLVSVQKDLKIKFTNKETDKLISNVPFSVTVTDPDGKTATWTDDDMDGIIYKKDITPGNYKVAVDAIAGEKYSDYILPTGTQTVEVKKDIAYKKIDVTNEIKKESEINAAKEDTKKNETVVESKLEDTVTWVESTATANTYVEVAKSSIPDPLTLVSTGAFMRMALTAGISESGRTVAAGDTFTLSASFTGDGMTAGNIQWFSSDTSVASVAGNGTSATVTALKAGTATISYTYDTTVVSGGDTVAGTTGQAGGTCMVTVTESRAIALDQTAVTVYLSEPVTINATIANATTQDAVTAESSDTGIATVAVNGRAVTITGVQAGSAVVIVKYVENGAELKATCAVTVKAHPKDDKSTKLKDSSGQQLYVLENETYREATYADYYTASKFFVKGSAKYTGWQTIDGKVYFFNAAGEKVTGEQVIQGAKYNFASDGSLVTGSGTMGIDVSKWNGTIDWNAVKNSGVSYVIIRCGYRGSSQGALIEDPKFKSNIQGATAAGLKVGVYFFTQAVDEVEAVEEASMVLEQISGYTISYPIFLDVEASGGRGDKIDKATRTAVCKAFCNTIQDAGYTAGIYANKTWLESKINTSELGAYKIWLAQYAASPTYTGRYDLWQYSSTGRVSGISGSVDLNLSYLGY